MVALFWAFVALTYAMQIIAVNYFVQYSGHIYTMSHALLMCGLLKLVEEMLLYDVPTAEVLKSNPIAYAIYIFAFAYLIGRAML